MTIKERMDKRKSDITKEEFDAYMKSDKNRMNKLFIRICDRLEDMFHEKKIHCDTCDDVFKIIEKYDIYIDDIVNKKDYIKLKKYIIGKKNKWCPVIGKKMYMI